MNKQIGLDGGRERRVNSDAHVSSMASMGRGAGYRGDAPGWGQGGRE